MSKVNDKDSDRSVHYIYILSENFQFLEMKFFIYI